MYSCQNRRKGFTLIELLVVISVIALLLSILMPALGRVKEQGKKTVCSAHLHGLGLAYTAYLSDNDGKSYPAVNHGLFEDMSTGEPLEPDDDYAYWGVAYAKYTDGKRIFRCPSQKRADDWPEWGWGEPYQKYFYYCSYGLNGYTAGVKIYSKFRRLGDVIGFQDHIEQKLDGTDSDMLCLEPNADVNMPQWRSSLDGGWGFVDTYWEGFDTVGECYRHIRSSNTLWLDGHVSNIKESYGEDVPCKWYNPDFRD